jgi:uncharacterized membrane protein
MEQIKIFSISKPQVLLKRALWIFLIAFAGKFILNVLPYFGFEKEVFQRYWDFKWWLMGHIVGGMLALVIGPFQFSETFRKKYLTAHRWFGRIYLTAILIGAISSTYLAWTSALAIHWTWALSLQCLAFAWVCTACMAYISIKLGRIQIHKEWMIKSYVVTFAFVTFRWLASLPPIAGLGNFIERAPTLVWVSWVIPLFLTNIILQWNKK